MLCNITQIHLLCRSVYILLPLYKLISLPRAAQNNSNHMCSLEGFLFTDFRISLNARNAYSQSKPSCLIFLGTSKSSYRISPLPSTTLVSQGLVMKLVYLFYIVAVFLAKDGKIASKISSLEYQRKRYIIFL